EEKQTLSVKFTADRNAYPLALDPTLSFTAPGQSNSGSVITGEVGVSSSFGATMTAGDFNSDGKMDFAVGAHAWNNGTGRVYLFYNVRTNTAATADVVISGTGSWESFGTTLVAGDMNSDGRTDLIVGTDLYAAANVGAVKIFYNDGSYPTTSATADVLITGEGASNNFGRRIATGDLNADGRMDLIVSAPGYGSSTGRAYIFYNDGTSLGTVVCTTGCLATDADAIITGETANDNFGTLGIGDFNADGKTDLAVGAYKYDTTDAGRVYIFYSGAITTENASAADVILSGGEGFFGLAITSGDFNADGTTDIAVGGSTASSGRGRVYIFYADGTSNFGTATCSGTPVICSATNADVIITGATTTNYFGTTMVAGDMNADGRTDIIACTDYWGTPSEQAYIFYNDGSYPTSAANADVIITTEIANNFFGVSLSVADWNSDGKMDLAIGAYAYASSTGRVYVFYSQNGQVNTNQNISGTVSGDRFGNAMVSGDFNADGRLDLAVSAYGYSTNTGRVYVFYNTGIYRTTTSASADVIITGETVSDLFGSDFTVGDLNNDGKVDLVVSAYGYSTNTGRVYIFYNGSIITENASGADVIITGEAASNYFGDALTAGDFNADGTIDLAVGAYGYNSNLGRAYIFHADGTNNFGTTTCSGTPSVCLASNADMIINGSATAYIYFAASLAAGDLDADGTTDLVVGSHNGGGWGYIHLFYNDGSIPITAVTADAIIANDMASSFGSALEVGDLNADGRRDLIVGANGYGGSAGRVYVFYNDGAYPTTEDTADITLIGEAMSNFFGISLAIGDWNSDGRVDLAVGALGYSTNTGRVYFFYNDGTLPTTAATADSIITGETTNNSFGTSLSTGDWNTDGRTDLAVGAYGYSTNTGRVYFYQTEENYSWKIHSLPPGQSLRTNVSGSGQEMQISGESSSSFGSAFASGDFNADGKIDLVVGAFGYNSYQGRVYLFYNTGSLSTSATNADVVITGANGSRFGSSLAAGDLDSDGKTDIIVGCVNNIYIFYNDGSYPITATTADVAITGGTNFGAYGLIVGDFNADGKTDIAIGTFNSWVYIFHNDGAYPATYTTADITITGSPLSGMIAGDFNADGRTDLALGTGSGNGAVYIFYNDGSIPTTVGTADVIISGEGSSMLGFALVAGDFNNDGRIDLVASATVSSVGRTYIFYNDGSIPTTAATADVILTGETTSDYFGYSLVSGDFNNDGKTDLIVGAYGYSSSKGRVYLYTWNDQIITGEATNNSFGTAMTAGDFNADGRIDLAVGANGYSTNTGRIYIFYQDGAIPSTAATADIIITGEATNNYFGGALTAADLNSDGRIDLVTGATGYNSNQGRAYIFYNDGSISTTAATADIIITGGAYFGSKFSAGDFNADGRIDIAISDYDYNNNNKAVYIFYNDGSIPTTSATADAVITGYFDGFGFSLTSGDFNADGRTDLAVGDPLYTVSVWVGRVAIFYNDGAYPASVNSADTIIVGESVGTDSRFGFSLVPGDFNADGRVDLAVGAPYYSNSLGRAYILYNDGSIPTTAATADVIITGEATRTLFGNSLVSGDFNVDGRTDLAVGGMYYNNTMGTGRVYTFYNDGSYQATAATADTIITGEANSNYFGYSLASSDFNSDGKTDLVVGATMYATYTGRVYMYTTEVAVKTSSDPAKTRGTVNLRGTVKLR
ncbi:MAG: FG-GAP-like repeat-containing protein, partial [Candidatus Moranbacteria bacterium]|nr:FG-GAP-like repeat-containing protein [Candidatus Moranbacteria bacterium]